ncbi:hypothetical protein EVA_15771 [gut metagenome]|uniref:Uncharacterized protein n=1 Tax=gut metagenome TaxID=749906 RepID=J9G9L2_9ZZZZ
MKQAYLHIDVMRGERFVKTIHMPYCPAFKVTSEQIAEYIKDKFPVLSAGGKFTFHVYCDE